jgi:general secretion pathway protein D
MQMSEQSTVLYQAVGRVAGINVLIDPDYHPVHVALDVKGVTALEALHILGELSNSFWKPVSRNTIFVAANTVAKRKSLQAEAMQIFYLSNIAQQSDLNDVQTALRNILTGAKMYAVPSQNAIVVKGTADEILLAKTMIRALDRARPEVLVDVYVLQVKRDKERKLGISPPTSLSVSSASSSTLNNIGSTSSYSYSMGNAAADLLLSDSTTRMLENPRIRALDGQKAVLKIGTRIPSATGTYTSGATAGSTTSFQYIDVGVNVEMTPTIHENRDITLKLSLEVSSESGTVTIDSVEEPEIAQQKVDQVIRLREGEVSILAGLVEKETKGAASGWPGLGEIPAAKYLFSTQDHEKVDNEIVFMLVPHIVRALESDPLGGQSIGTGSGDVIELQMEGAHAPKQD